MADPPSDHDRGDSYTTSTDLTSGPPAPGAEAGLQHPHSLSRLYRAIWPERTLYSPGRRGCRPPHPPLPAAPEAGLLADDPGLHHNTRPDFGGLIASAVFDGGRAREVGYIFVRWALPGGSPSC